MVSLRFGIMKRIATALVLLTFVVPLAWCASAGGQDTPGQKPKVKFTVGKDTTYATGPLDKDGFVDYVSALNERLGKGATPANNAVVALCQAFGPRPEGAPLPAKFYTWLGIKEPPEK